MAREAAEAVLLAFPVALGAILILMDQAFHLAQSARKLEVAADRATLIQIMQVVGWHQRGQEQQNILVAQAAVAAMAAVEVVGAQAQMAMVITVPIQTAEQAEQAGLAMLVMVAQGARAEQIAIMAPLVQQAQN